MGNLERTSSNRRLFGNSNSRDIREMFSAVRASLRRIVQYVFIKCVYIEFHASTVLRNQYYSSFYDYCVLHEKNSFAERSKILAGYKSEK